MLTFILLAAGVIVVIGALLTFTSVQRGKASKAVQSVRASPEVGRAEGQGND